MNYADNISMKELIDDMGAYTHIYGEYKVLTSF